MSNCLTSIVIGPDAKKYRIERNTNELLYAKFFLSNGKSIRKLIHGDFNFQLIRWPKGSYKTSLELEKCYTNCSGISSINSQYFPTSWYVGYCIGSISKNNIVADVNGNRYLANKNDVIISPMAIWFED